MSEQKKFPLPPVIRMQVAIEYAEKLLASAASKMNWTPQDIKRAIQENRIGIGNDEKGIYLYLDGKPLSGALMPEITTTTFNNETAVFIKGQSTDDIPSLEECKDVMDKLEA